MITTGIYRSRYIPVLYYPGYYPGVYLLPWSSRAQGWVTAVHSRAILHKRLQHACAERMSMYVGHHLGPREPWHSVVSHGLQPNVPGWGRPGASTTTYQDQGTTRGSGTTGHGRDHTHAVWGPPVHHTHGFFGTGAKNRLATRPCMDGRTHTLLTHTRNSYPYNCTYHSKPTMVVR